MPRPSAMSSPRTSITRASTTSADLLTSCSNVSGTTVIAAAGIPMSRQTTIVKALRSIRRVYDIEHGVCGAIARPRGAEASPNLSQRGDHARAILAIGKQLHGFGGDRLRRARVLNQLHDHSLARDQVHHRIGVDQRHALAQAIG